MATITLRSARFLVGETISAYLQSNWTVADGPPTVGSAAKGSAVGTAVVAADGTTTLSTGLIDNTWYYARGGTSGAYVRFLTATATPTNAALNTRVTANEVAVRNLDRDGGQAGMIAIPPGVGRVATGLTSANRAYAIRFVPSRDMLIALIGFAVTTADTVDDPCDVGIYSAALSKIVSAGATLGKLNSLGAKTVAITPTQLTAGTVYYAAFSIGTIGAAPAPQVDMTSIPGVAASADVYGNTAGKREQTFMAAGHPLPSTFTLGAITAVPVLWLRES